MENERKRLMEEEWNSMIPTDHKLCRVDFPAKFLFGVATSAYQLLGMVSGFPRAPPRHHRPPMPPPLRPVLPVRVVPFATDQTGGSPPAMPVLPRRPLRLHPVAGFPPSPYPPALYWVYLSHPLTKRPLTILQPKNS
ncbi:hypothetical protein Hanom_Chr12g01131261 [Helianthus anomalus]